MANGSKLSGICLYTGSIFDSLSFFGGPVLEEEGYEASSKGHDQRYCDESPRVLPRKGGPKSSLDALRDLS